MANNLTSEDIQKLLMNRDLVYKSIDFPGSIAVIIDDKKCFYTNEFTANEILTNNFGNQDEFAHWISSPDRWSGVVRECLKFYTYGTRDLNIIKIDCSWVDGDDYMHEKSMAERMTDIDYKALMLSTIR